MPETVRSILSRKIEIPSDRYLIDLELHDRYCKFSAELLKLALAGVAAIGFFLSTLSHDTVFSGNLNSQLFKGATLASVFLLAFSAGAALLHRFLAADGMYYHFRAMKLLVVLENDGNNPDVANLQEGIRTQIYANEATRNKKYKICGWLLFFSSALLFGGAAALAASLIGILK